MVYAFFVLVLAHAGLNVALLVDLWSSRPPPRLRRRTVSNVDQHYRKATRPAALSKARRLAGLATPAPLVVEPVSDAELEPPVLVLVAPPLPPVMVPDGAAAVVELPVSKKTPPAGPEGALVGTAEDEVDELAAEVLVLEADELEKTLVSKWRPPATEYLEAQLARSEPSGQQTVAPAVSAAQ